MENALIHTHTHTKKTLQYYHHNYDRQKIPYIVQMVISSSEIG